MSNVILFKDCLHPRTVEMVQNNQRISLHKLANRHMGENKPCLVSVNGELVPDDWHRVIDSSDVVAFGVLAAGGGGGDKDTFRMVAMLALIAAVKRTERLRDYWTR